MYVKGNQLNVERGVRFYTIFCRDSKDISQILHAVESLEGKGKLFQFLLDRIGAFEENPFFLSKFSFSISGNCV